MSITDELREWASIEVPYKYGHQLLAIADRIDAEHERQLGVLYRDMSDAEWVRLPKDADGEAWHIGDRTESGQTIEAMGLNKHGWHFVGTVNEIDPAIHRHHHAPTVEDVLREFAAKLCIRDGFTEATEETFAEYAAKLRLAEGEDA